MYNMKYFVFGITIMQFDTVNNNWICLGFGVQFFFYIYISVSIITNRKNYV